MMAVELVNDGPFTLVARHLRPPATAAAPYAGPMGMGVVGSLQYYIALLLGLAALAMEVFALVDALRHRSEAFTAAGKLTKQIWTIILVVAVAIGFVTATEPARHRHPARGRRRGLPRRRPARPAADQRPGVVRQRLLRLLVTLASDRSADVAARRAGWRPRGPDHRVGAALDRLRPRAGRLDRDHPAVRLRASPAAGPSSLPRPRRVCRPRDRLDLRRPGRRARGGGRARAGHPGARGQHGRRRPVLAARAGARPVRAPGAR